MASGGGGGSVSLRSLIKDKIKHSAIGETVSGKINSMIKHDHKEVPQQASGGDNSLLFSPSHTRSASMDSVGSDRGSVVSFKAPLSPMASNASDNVRNGFEIIDSVEDVKDAQKSDVYEQQLVQLQEQLVSSMIENQNMAAELKGIREDKQIQKMDKELAYERKKNEELVAKISSIAQLHSSRRETPAPDSTDRAVDDANPAVTEDAEESTAGVQDSQDTGLGWIDAFFYSILQRYYQIVEDFSVTSEDIDEPEVLEPLSVKLLKDNVKRFGSGISPIFNMMSSFHLLFNWDSPLLTGTVFFVYMYLCWVGFLVPGLLFVLVLRLTLNLLEEMKVIPAICLLPRKKRAEPEKEKESSSVSDKFNIVLEVATKGQKKFGQMADGLEKAKNLLMWKRVEDSKQIFIPLCVGFVLTLFLNLDTIMFLVGSFLGMKLFVIDPIYNRFPRIKERYDSTHRIWQNLLTDAQLERYSLRNANNQMVLTRYHSSPKAASLSSSSRQSSAGSLLSTADIMSEEDKSFCDRFDLPDDEIPLADSPFKGGRHCIHVDKESAFKVSSALQNHAKLYLTSSFLCYEMVRHGERRAIPLANIVRITKKKPISFLPGAGMALEIVEQGFDKPHIFGGLLNRDLCYKSLMDIGRRNSLLYAMSHDEVKQDIRLSDLTDGDDHVSQSESSAVVNP